MGKVKSLPQRSQVKTEDTWDLSSLFPDDDAWEKAFLRFEKQIPKYSPYRGTLGESAQALATCLKFDSKLDRQAERLGVYAFLKMSEDQTDSAYQRMVGRYQNAATRASEAGSFIRPEVMAIPSKKMQKFLAAPELKHFRLSVERMLRYKKHTLGKQEERGSQCVFQAWVVQREARPD